LSVKNGLRGDLPRQADKRKRGVLEPKKGGTLQPSLGEPHGQKTAAESLGNQAKPVLRKRGKRESKYAGFQEVEWARDFSTPPNVPQGGSKRNKNINPRQSQRSTGGGKNPSELGKNLGMGGGRPIPGRPISEGLVDTRRAGSC